MITACADPAPPPNILLVTVDTLRADHLSSYGYPRPTSPHFDALPARGVRFDNAWVQWPKTTPSIASMMTATYPKDNGIVREVGQRLHDELRTWWKIDSFDVAVDPPDDQDQEAMSDETRKQLEALGYL